MLSTLPPAAAPTCGAVTQYTDTYAGLCSLPLPVRVLRVAACEVGREAPPRDVPNVAVAAPEAVVGAPALDHPRAIPVGSVVKANWKRGGMK